MTLLLYKKRKKTRSWLQDHSRFLNSAYFLPVLTSPPGLLDLLPRRSREPSSLRSGPRRSQMSPHLCPAGRRGSVLPPRVCACRGKLLQVPGVLSPQGPRQVTSPNTGWAPAGLGVVRAPRPVSPAAGSFQDLKACARAHGLAPRWHGPPDSCGGLIPVCAAGSALPPGGGSGLGLGCSRPVPESSCPQLEHHRLTPHPKQGDFIAFLGALESVQGWELTALQPWFIAVPTGTLGLCSHSSWSSLSLPFTCPRSATD